jgi:hypothetical protein
MKRELLQMQEVLARKQLAAIYLLFPELDDVQHPGQFALPRQTVSRLLAELKLPLCDPYPDFAGAPDPAALFLPGDSVHFTPAGQRIVAERLASCLRSTPLLPLSADAARPPG